MLPLNQIRTLTRTDSTKPITLSEHSYMLEDLQKKLQYSEQDMQTVYAKGEQIIDEKKDLKPDDEWLSKLKDEDDKIQLSAELTELIHLLRKHNQDILNNEISINNLKPSEIADTASMRRKIWIQTLLIHLSLSILRIPVYGAIRQILEDSMGTEGNSAFSNQVGDDGDDPFRYGDVNDVKNEWVTNEVDRKIREATTINAIHAKSNGTKQKQLDTANDTKHYNGTQTLNNLWALMVIATIGRNARKNLQTLPTSVEVLKTAKDHRLRLQRSQLHVRNYLRQMIADRGWAQRHYLDNLVYILGKYKSKTLNIEKLNERIKNGWPVQKVITKAPVTQYTPSTTLPATYYKRLYELTNTGESVLKTLTPGDLTKAERAARLSKLSEWLIEAWQYFSKYKIQKQQVLPMLTYLHPSEHSGSLNAQNESLYIIRNFHDMFHSSEETQSGGTVMYANCKDNKELGRTSNTAFMITWYFYLCTIEQQQKDEYELRNKNDRESDNDEALNCQDEIEMLNQDLKLVIM